MLRTEEGSSHLGQGEAIAAAEEYVLHGMRTEISVLVGVDSNMDACKSKQDGGMTLISHTELAISNVPQDTR